MSSYIGNSRQSFRGNNVLTVVCNILKIIQNDFKLLWPERVTNFKTTLESIYENYQNIMVKLLLVIV